MKLETLLTLLALTAAPCLADDGVKLCVCPTPPPDIGSVAPNFRRTGFPQGYDPSTGQAQQNRSYAVQAGQQPMASVAPRHDRSRRDRVLGSIAFLSVSVTVLRW